LIRRAILLSQLQETGDDVHMGAFDMSPATLFAGLVVSGIGFAVFKYGKTESQFTQIFTGLALMACPMVVPGALANYAACAGLLGVMWASDRYLG